MSRQEQSRSSHRPAGLFQTYGVLGLLRLGRDLLATRLVLPQARLVRMPFYVRGRRWMRIGPGLTTGTAVRLDAFPRSAESAPVLHIGRDVQINDAVHIAAVESVRIGDRVLIASRVFISDHNHGAYSGNDQSSPEIAPDRRPLSAAPVVIEDDVWIGEGAAVLPGVTIGRGSVIGALALVNRDVPPYSIAVGNPAHVVKRYDHESKQWLRA